MRRTTCTIALFAAGAAAGVSPALRAEEANRANKWFVGTAAGLPSGDTQSAVSFGYQGFAGATYEINDRMEVGLVYKFLGTTDQEFDDFKIEGTRTHTLGVSFMYRF